jgi:chromosome segregation ATPase
VPDSDVDPGTIFGIVGAIVAGGTLWLQYREHRRAASHDEIQYLQRQIEDLQRSNHVCEQRCEELREQVMELLASVATTPRRRRRTSAE